MSQIPIGWLMKKEGFLKVYPKITTGFYDDRWFPRAPGPNLSLPKGQKIDPNLNLS
jgi:hypothetical protein